MCQVEIASGVASALPRNDIPRNDITPDSRNNKEIMGNQR